MVEYINGKRVIDGYTEGARVYNNAHLSANHDSYTALTFNSEDYDTDSIHDTGSNTGRLTCRTAGKYLIVVNIKFATDADGYRWIYCPLNGAGGIAQSTGVATGAGEKLNGSVIYDLSVGDYVTAYVYHNAGGAINVEYEAKFSPYFMIQRIG